MAVALFLGVLENNTTTMRATRDSSRPCMATHSAHQI